MVRNVLASWAGQAVFIVAGFIMPRLIDRQLGQGALGVWDFSWSLVAYLTLMQGGIIASINRYVARFRAVGDIDGVNTVVSSVWLALLVVSVVVLLAGAGIALALPLLLRGTLAGYLAEAQWIVFLLSASTSVQMASATFGGVITGCHRWDLHNLILGGGHVLVVAGMILVLLSGGGLVGMAAVTLAGQALAGVARYCVARRVLPEMRVRVRLARWRTLRNMLTFGGKSLLPTIAELLSNQTVAVLVVSFLGAPALAIYARPRSLLRHARTLVTKFAMVLIPTASSLEATSTGAELPRFLVAAGKYGAYIALPILTVLALMGGPLIRLWMGPNYELGALAAALAVGHATTILAMPVIYVLTGLNAHGKPAIAVFVAGLVGVGLVALALGQLRLGLVGAAWAIGIPLTAANGVFVPIYACRRVGLPITSYLRGAYLRPILCVIPFGVCLALARLAFPDSPGAAVLGGVGVGAVVLAWLYWRIALPPSAKSRVLCRFGLSSRRSEWTAAQPEQPPGQVTAAPEGKN